MLHVWYIYLHLGDFRANFGKYSIHGAYGILGQYPIFRQTQMFSYVIARMATKVSMYFLKG